jgi:solute carrier family 35 protein C2
MTHNGRTCSFAFFRNCQAIFQKLFKTGELKEILISLATILIYYCFSIVLTFYNRHLFVTYKYPLSITLIHLIFKFIMASIIRSCFNCYNKRRRSRALGKSNSDALSTYKDRIVLDWATYFRRVVPTGIASAADIGFSN